jgi:hypothetical protein
VLDGEHGIVNGFANGGLLCFGFQLGPAGFLRDPEGVGGAVFIRVFRISSAGTVGFEFGVLRLEGIRNVFEEDQAEDDVLVLAASMLERSASAARQSSFSKPRFAPFSVVLPILVFLKIRRSCAATFHSSSAEHSGTWSPGRAF